MSTDFERKKIYKATCRPPDRKTTNKIDHVLIEKRDKIE